MISILILILTILYPTLSLSFETDGSRPHCFYNRFTINNTMLLNIIITAQQHHQTYSTLYSPSHSLLLQQYLDSFSYNLTILNPGIYTLCFHTSSQHYVNIDFEWHQITAHSHYLSDIDQVHLLVQTLQERQFQGRLRGSVRLRILDSFNQVVRDWNLLKIVFSILLAAIQLIYLTKLINKNNTMV